MRALKATYKNTGRLLSRTLQAFNRLGCNQVVEYPSTAAADRCDTNRSAGTQPWRST